MSARQVALPGGRVWVEYDVGCRGCAATTVARVASHRGLGFVEHLPPGWDADDSAPDAIRRYWCARCRRHRRPRA